MAPTNAERLKLPDNLWPLTQRQAIALRAESFEADATAISRSLTQLAVARRSQQVPVWTAGAALAAALATGVLLGPVVLQALHLPLFGLSAAYPGAAFESGGHRGKCAQRFSRTPSWVSPLTA